MATLKVVTDEKGERYTEVTTSEGEYIYALGGIVAEGSDVTFLGCSQAGTYRIQTNANISEAEQRSWLKAVSHSQDGEYFRVERYDKNADVKILNLVYVGTGVW